MKFSRITAAGFVLLAFAAGVQASLPARIAGSSEPFYYVAPAPPPALAETPAPAPGSDDVWINGYWKWDGGQYVWQDGYWTEPPAAGAVWVAPRYEKKKYYYGGYWGYGRHRDRIKPYKQQY